MNGINKLIPFYKKWEWNVILRSYSPFPHTKQTLRVWLSVMCGIPLSYTTLQSNLLLGDIVLSSTFVENRYILKVRNRIFPRTVRGHQEKIFAFWSPALSQCYCDASNKPFVGLVELAWVKFGFRHLLSYLQGPFPVGILDFFFL